ncbi:MAG TPA: hypothetical protein VFO36_04295 [Nitrospiraceae bacterium]|nr:hypothetical protein [Nitrospiraceae bacterium]
MSDEELAQICASMPVEEWLFAAVCLGSMVAVLLLPGVLIFGGAVLFFFLGLLLALNITFCAHRLLGRLRRPYRDELAYRCGQSAFSRYVEEAQVALGQLRADWLILFTTTGLPHGDHRWLRIELREGTLPSARAELRVSWPSLALSCTRTETDIPHDDTTVLLSTLQALDLSALTDLPSLIIDGEPSTVAILRRHSPELAVASCNLASDWEKEVQHPTARICAELYGLTLKLTKAGPAA